MKIEHIDIDKIKLNPINPRSITDEAFKKLVKSLKDCPQLFDARPCICSDRTGQLVVLGGNMRLRAALELKYDEVPVIIMHGLTEAQEKEIIIKDNGDFGQWDFELLKADFGEFALADYGVSLPDNFLKVEQEKKIDAEPQIKKADELRESWGVDVGQLWRLGDHRIICADSRDGIIVKKLLMGDTPHLMVTDPPYGIEYDAKWRQTLGYRKNLSTGVVLNDDKASWSSAFKHFTGSVAYVWHASSYGIAVERSLAVLGFEVRAQIVWVKKNFTISSGHYHWRHENCFYVVRKGETGHWNGDRKQNTAWSDILDNFPISCEDLFACAVDDQTIYAFNGNATTVWDLKRDVPQGGGHSTQKPVECMARPIRNNSKPGDCIYEPFSGSGTTIIACENLGRKCRAVELSPGYVAVAIQRWVDVTGGVPERIK